MTITASSVTIVIVRFIWLSFAPGFRFLYFSLNCTKSKCMKAWIRTTIINITVMAVMQALKESLPVYSSEEKNKKFSSSASTVLKVLWSILSTIVCLKWMNAGIPCGMPPTCAVRTASRGVYWGRERHHDEAACNTKKKKRRRNRKKKKKRLRWRRWWFFTMRERDFITTTRMSDEYNKHYYHILLCRYWWWCL